MKTGLCMIVAFASMLIVWPVGAELRQWTDEKGVKHFSNRKDLPGGVQAERSWEEKESHLESGQPQWQTPSDSGEAYQHKPADAETSTLMEISRREARLKEIFEEIYAKRRYVKRQGKKDIERIRRLDAEIAQLEKSGETGATQIEPLKQEMDDAKERLFNDNLRTRKGVGDNIQEYKKVEAEIKVLKERLKLRSQPR